MVKALNSLERWTTYMGSQHCVQFPLFFSPPCILENPSIFRRNQKVVHVLLFSPWFEILNTFTLVLSLASNFCDNQKYISLPRELYGREVKYYGVFFPQYLLTFKKLFLSIFITSFMVASYPVWVWDLMTKRKCDDWRDP